MNKTRPARLQTRYTYTDGPMMFIGQQIVRAMQQAGWDAKISECYRSPERQRKLMKTRFSNADMWESPHQYYLAVDIIHAKLGWKVDPRFWQDLAAAVAVVQKKFGVLLEHGHTWTDPRDSAHIELADFRRWRSMYFGRPPTGKELDHMFAMVLPNVWNDYKKSAAFNKHRVNAGA